VKFTILFLNTFFKPTAYLDPGTGSILIQLILAGLLGVGVAIRIFWDKIKGLFNKKGAIDEDVNDPTSLSEDDLID